MTCFPKKGGRRTLVRPEYSTLMAAGLFVLLTVVSTVAWGQAVLEGGGKEKASVSGEPMPPQREAPRLPPAEQYCDSVQEAASAAKSAIQKKELEKMQAALEDRIKVLNDKTAETRVWLQKREDFLKQANENLTAIYSKMAPESAAARLLLMNEMTAAAILSKLSPKGASSILAEIDTAKAARLSSLLAGVAEIPAKGSAREKERP